MRFYVPNMIEASGKSEDAEMKKDEGNKAEGDDADEPEEDEETPA